MFPNPSQGELKIELEDNESAFQRLIISSLDGRTVFQSNVLLSSYDISRLVPGAYIVSVELNNGLASEILIKK
jgi:hypothetical protein